MTDYADMSTEEYELIEARAAYRSAYARHYGIARLGHDDRHAMPLRAAEKRLAAAKRAMPTAADDGGAE